MGTDIGISVVMPAVVHTELGSGLPDSRGVKPVEPEDVAAAIAEALEYNRFDVYVPRSMVGIVRLNALMPRRVMDRVSKLLKGDQVLTHPDHGARAAYEARMERTIAAAAEREKEPV
jgi:short-subunit dehydrogenase